MSNDGSKSRFLRYSESPLTGTVVTALSLFVQWLNWFAFEKLGYSWGFTLVTPLILCLMYHFIQLDAGREGNFSRRFFAMFSIVIPLLIGVLLTVVMLLAAPDISTFNPDADYAGTIQESIATYSGRFVVTSAYIGVFALIDIPVLDHLDKKRTEQ